MDKSLSEFLEGLPKEVTEVVVNAAQEAVSETAKGWIIQFGSGALTAATDELLKGVAGILAKALLKYFLGVSVSLTSKVDALLNDPYQTGVRNVRDALSLRSETDAERNYRENLLRDGIKDLEHAWTLANGKTKERDRFVIRLLQGLAVTQVSGGHAHAAMKLSDCLTALSSAQMAADRQAKELLREIGALQRSVAEFKALWGDPPVVRNAHPEDDTARSIRMGYSQDLRALDDAQQRYRLFTARAAFCKDFATSLQARP
ncbi:MAG TPA: hypothetical protein VM074_07840 [Solimonas sp.]|nr:hypothetical protein [Solimonas sp.]